MEIVNRVIGLRMIKANEISPNKKNFRRHPKTQVQALKQVIEELGFIDPILAVEDENGKYKIIDGHLRVGLAEDQEIPVILLNLTPEEQDKALLTVDPIAAMAMTDKTTVDSLLKNVSIPPDLLAEMVKKGQASKDVLDIGIPVSLPSDEAGFSITTEGNMTGDPTLPQVDVTDIRKNSLESIQIEPNLGRVFVLNESAIFESNLPYDIPFLRDDMLSALPSTNLQTFAGANTSWKEEDSPDKWWIYVYKSAGVEAVPKDRSIVCFYTDDSAFEQVWTTPVLYTRRMLDMRFKVTMSPNYSLWGEFPEAMWIWNIYRARWIGRFFQEAGLRLIPDVEFCWNPKKQLSDYMDLFLCGIPKFAPVLSTQIQTTTMNDEVLQNIRYGLSIADEKLQPENWILYGSKLKITEMLGDLPMFGKSVIVESWSQERIRTRYAKADSHSLHSKDSYGSYNKKRELEELNEQAGS